MAEGIILENVVKTYGSGETAVHALRGVDMAVAKGEVVGLIGPSGSGKSTLLKCLGAVIEPTSGKMTIGDQCIYDNRWKVRDLRALRRDMIGFIFQAPYLIPFLDVTDNVALLPMLAGKPNAVARKEARDLLDALDVAHRATAMPSQLSGGEQQRVAIARALAMRPKVMLFDEVTSALDPQLVGEVLDTMRMLSDEGMTMMLVTHEIRFARDVSDRVAFFRNGVIHEIGTPAQVIDNPEKSETIEF